MRKILSAIGQFVKKASEDSVPAYAAQITFFVLLSFFPFMILIIMIASKLSLSSQYIIDEIMAVVPNELEEYMKIVVDDLEYSNTTSFTVITIVLSLWSAAKGIQAMIYGLNRVYRVEKQKNYLYLRLASAGYTLAFMVLLLIIIIAHVFGSLIARQVVAYFPSWKSVAILIVSLKNCFTFVALFLVFLLMYYQLPGRDTKKNLMNEMAGAGIASLVWLLMTSAFSAYVKYAASASYMYGSLTSLILTIVWLYIGMQIILYGAEINYYMAIYLEKKRDEYKIKKDSKKKNKKNRMEEKQVC